MAYGAELVPVVGGVISGGVDAGITKAAGLAAMNAFLGKNVAVGKVTPLSNLLSPTSKDVHSSGGDPAPGSAAERMAEARLAAGEYVRLCIQGFFAPVFTCSAASVLPTRWYV